MDALAQTAFPEFVKPTAPDLLPIDRLHRGSDGYISFHSKNADNPDGLNNLFSVRADELSEYFPQFIEQLDRNGYYSINGFYRAGFTKSKYNPALMAPLRRSNALRWLNACFVDIDCGRDGAADYYDTYASALRMQDEDVIPPVSMTVHSGRGFWLFWFLHDGDGNTPVKAWPENVRTYAHLQEAICQRLARLESDSKAKDAARITRVPGSVNTKVNRRVSYSIHYDSSGRGYIYTPEQLCQFLDVSVHALPRKVEALCAERVARGEKGFRARWRSALKQLDTLRALRGGFREGHRHFAMPLYGRALKYTGHEDQIDETLHTIGAECNPPLTRSECKQQIREVKASNMRSIRNQTISDWLEVTIVEASQLSSWPPATKFGGNPQIATLTKAQHMERRRDFIRRNVKPGSVPTLEAMNELLEDAGLRATEPTIRTDYLAIGLKNPRRHGRKKHADDQQLRLPRF